jgi:hypothetical protein
VAAPTDLSASGQADGFADRVLRQRVGGGVAVDDADGVLFQHADLAGALFSS